MRRARYYCRDARQLLNPRARSYVLEGFRNALAFAIAPTETKGVMLGSGVYDFHGPRGTGNLIYSDGRGALPSSDLSRETAFAVAAMCYAATQYRADNVAEAPPRVARIKDDDSFEFVEHPLNELLAEPSEDYDMSETMWLTQSSLDIYAKSLWTKEENRVGSTGELRPWSGREFDVEADNGRIFGKYRLRTSRGTEDLSPDEVVHFKHLSPYDRYEGISPTDASLRWLSLGSDVEDSIRRLILNGMFPSTVLSPDKDWRPDDEEFKLFKRELTNYHTGPANTGKPLVAMGGTKVTRVAFTLEDLLPAEIMDRIEATVAMCFGIAPVVLGALVGLKNSPWSQMEQARRQTYDDTIVPLWDRHGRVLTRQLLRPLDSRTDHVVIYDTSKVAALQENRSQQIEDADKAKTWTLDERRTYAGQDEVGGEQGAWIEATSQPDRRADAGRRADDGDTGEE